MSKLAAAKQTLSILLRALKLPGFVAHWADLAKHAEKEGIGFEDYLRRLCEVEIDERQKRKTLRLLRESGLPKDKTLATLDQARLPAAVRKQLPTLCHGDFVKKAENVLAFGLPGRGKTHLCCAIGYELIQRQYRVLFVPTFKLVQRLLVAKRDLTMEKELVPMNSVAGVCFELPLA